MNTGTILRQILVAATGAVLAVTIISVGGLFGKFEFARILGALTEDNLRTSSTITDIDTKIMKNTEKVDDVIRVLKSSERPLHRNRIDLPGELNWGVWHDPEFCPQNHYVCGLSQKVERPLGPDSDDTAVNSVGLWCCQLPEISP